MGDTRSQSLFVVLSYDDDDAPYLCSIVQLDTLVDSKPSTPEQIINPRVFHTQYLAHVKQPAPGLPLSRWSFSPPPSSSNDFYMVPARYPDNDPPLHGATFNCSTNEFRLIRPPKAFDFGGRVVAVGRDVYFMANVPGGHVFYRNLPDFDAWDKWGHHHTGSREDLKRHGPNSEFVASAVWDDTIIFNMCGYRLWAYHVPSGHWYHVLVQDDNKNKNRCYSIVGEGFVVNNVIYALSKHSVLTVLALAIQKKQVNGDLEYSCSLLDEIYLPHTIQIQDAQAYRKTRHFVHLGEDNFCLVQSCDYAVADVEYQPIHLTGLKLMGKGKMVVTDVCIHKLRIRRGGDPYGQFHVKLCFFSQPECKTSALKQGETTLIFDLCTGLVSKQDKTDFDPHTHRAEVEAPVQEKENETLPPLATAPRPSPWYDLARVLETPDLGYNCDEADLPPEVAARKLGTGLKRFWEHESDGIEYIDGGGEELNNAIPKFKKMICLPVADFEGVASEFKDWR